MQQQLYGYNYPGKNLLVQSQLQAATTTMIMTMAATKTMIMAMDAITTMNKNITTTMTQNIAIDMATIFKKVKKTIFIACSK